MSIFIICSSVIQLIVCYLKKQNIVEKAGNLKLLNLQKNIQFKMK